MDKKSASDLAAVHLSFSPSGSCVHADDRSAFDESPMPADSDHPLNLSGIGDLLVSLPTGPRAEHCNGLCSTSGKIFADSMSLDTSFILLGPSEEEPPLEPMSTAESQKMWECAVPNQDPSPATLLPPPMPINIAVASETCWAQLGSLSRGRAVPARSPTPPDQRQRSSSSSPLSHDRSGKSLAEHAGSGSTPSAFEWRPPVPTQLAGAPQFGSHSIAGSIVHRMPSKFAGSVSPAFHGHEVSSVMSMPVASTASPRTPHRGRPQQ